MWMFLLLLAAGAVAGWKAFQLYSGYQARAAQFDLTRIQEVPQRSAVYDANGELYSYYQGENRLIVPLDKISGWFVQALLAREDTRFWEHDGLDYRGIARAAWTNYRGGGVKQGASTLTQQLAKNTFEMTGRSYDRKAVEALIAQRIERTFSKKQIIEFYINRIYFGGGYYGIETASRGYFGKPASDLTLGESALLAGLIRSPNKFSPARNLEAALGERDAVLDRMVEEWMVTAEQAGAGKAQLISVNREPALRFQEDYVMDAVHRQVQEVLDADLVEQGGLRIYMTVDPQLQRLAQTAADRQLTKIEEGKGYPHPRKADFQLATGGGEEKPTDYLQAAVVAVDNRTGAIRAIVGGRDYAQSKYHRALLSQRQIGSTFKPFVYAAAFTRGLLPGTLVDDSKIAPGEFRTISGKWSPANSDGDYLGLQRADFGLIKSRNTMTVRIGEGVGLPAVRAMADAVRIGEKMPPFAVSYLGAFETTLKDLTGAYTVFPNNGLFRAPHLVARVEDTAGNVLYRADVQEKRVLREDTAWMTSSILQQVLKSGTASKAAQLGWKKPGAGKTGTTNDFLDAWFLGYTSSLTCGVWVGMDKPETIMEKGYGSALALPIWVDFMQSVPEHTYPAKNFESPIELMKTRLCSVSGALATAGCDAMNFGYDTQLPATRLPGGPCLLHPAPLPPAPIYAQQPFYPSAGTMPTTPSTLAMDGQSAAPGAPFTTPPSYSSTRSDMPVPMPAPTQRPLAVDFYGPAGSAPRAGAEQVRVERTAEGLRIYRRAPDATEQPAAPAQPTPNPRVMRAIPVDPQLRRSAAEPPPQQQPVRVLRAEPVTRDAAGNVTRGRVLRVVPPPSEDER